MAFRLRTDESVAQGLRRLTRKELKQAAARLEATTPPGAEAIHVARKGLKKARAILKVVEADHGKGTRRARKRVHLINRTLSPLRDTDALIEMLTKLSHHDPHLFDEHTLARLRRHFRERRDSALRAVQRRGALKKVIGELRALRRDATKWQPSHRGFGALAHGIRVTHRHGRRALATARASQRAVDFHDWRKRVKALYYQLRLVEDSGAKVQHDVEALRTGERALGEEHNLVMLGAQLSRRGVASLAAIDPARVRSSVDKYQRELRAQAIRAIAAIYKQKSRDYARNVKRTWKHKSANSRRTYHRAMGPS